MFIFRTTSCVNVAQWAPTQDAGTEVVGSIPRITGLYFSLWEKIMARLTFAVRSFHFDGTL